MNLTEVDVADWLLEFRSMQDGFTDTSFDTISGIVIFILAAGACFSIIIKYLSYYGSYIHSMRDMYSFPQSLLQVLEQMVLLYITNQSQRAAVV